MAMSAINLTITVWLKFYAQNLFYMISSVPTFNNYLTLQFKIGKLIFFLMAYADIYTEH